MIASNFPPNSKVWIYFSKRDITTEEQAFIAEKLDTFIASWQWRHLGTRSRTTTTRIHIPSIQKGPTLYPQDKRPHLLGTNRSCQLGNQRNQCRMSDCCSWQGEEGRDGTVEGHRLRSIGLQQDCWKRIASPTLPQRLQRRSMLSSCCCCLCRMEKINLECRLESS